MGIFLSSDYHLNHNKDFIYKARGFECVEDMNEEIVKRHNEVVRWDDDIYLLGDLMLMNDEEGIKYLRRLNGAFILSLATMIVISVFLFILP